MLNTLNDMQTDDRLKFKFLVLFHVLYYALVQEYITTLKKIQYQKKNL